MLHNYKNMYKKIEGIFSSANKNGGFNYIFTLVRVIGIEYKPDEFIILKSELDQFKQIRDPKKEDYRKMVGYIENNEELISFLINLSNCTKKVAYSAYPLRPLLDNNSFFDSLLKILGDNQIFYPVLDIFRIKSTDLEKEDFEDKASILITFIRILINYYFYIKVSYKKYFSKNNFIPLQKFDVLEPTIDMDDGLVGFMLYFSNESTAYFIRKKDGTESLNISILNNMVSPWVGNLSKQKNIWMIKNKPLYEIGIPGKYNKIGEWKPIVYPGTTDIIDEKMRDADKKNEDERVEGCYFYIVATCYHAIEFIVKGNFDLPNEYSRSEFTLSHDDGRKECLVLHVHKIEPVGEQTNYHANLCVYDCHIDLPDIGLDTIRYALNIIDIFIARLGFQFDAKIEWFLKYTRVNHDRGIAHIKNEDNTIIKNFLMNFNSEDSDIIDAAIGWYLNANRSSNVFQKFLSYCIAFEGLAIPFIEGKLKLSNSFSIPNINTTKEEKIACINFKQDSNKNDPIKFIEESYFNCIIGLNNKLKTALKIVFGENHKYYKLFLEKGDDGYSLYEIRSNLAHGKFKIHDSEHLLVTSKRVHEMREIAQGFIYKIINIKGGGESRSVYDDLSFSLINVTCDPRSTSICTSLDFIPNKDWRIRLSWLI